MKTLICCYLFIHGRFITYVYLQATTISTTAESRRLNCRNPINWIRFKERSRKPRETRKFKWELIIQHSPPQHSIETMEDIFLTTIGLEVGFPILFWKNRYSNGYVWHLITDEAKAGRGCPRVLLWGKISSRRNNNGEERKLVFVSFKYRIVLDANQKEATQGTSPDV